MCLLPIEDVVTVHPMGDTFSVAYTSIGDWKMEMKDGYETPSWISPSVKSGKRGTTVVNFSVQPNLIEDRVCTITFRSGGIEKSFDVSQEELYLNISQGSFNFGWEKSGDTGQIFNVESNVEWVVDVEDEDKFSVDYSKLSAGYATGNEAVTIKAIENNLAMSSAQSNLVVRPIRLNNKGEVVALDKEVETYLKKDIELTQDFLIFVVENFNSDADLDSFSELGDDYVRSGAVSAGDHITRQTVVVTSEVDDWGYSMSDINTSLNTWGISLTKKSQYLSDKLTQQYGRDINVTELEICVAKPNPEKKTRTGNFDLYLTTREGEHVNRTITLHQDAYQFDTDGNATVEFENLSGQAEFEISTTGPWHFNESEIPSWLTVYPLSGVGTATISVKADSQNLNFKDNSTDLVVYSGLNDMKSDQKFTQKKFIFKIEGADQFAEPLSRLDLSEYIVYVTSSGPWTLNCSSGSGDDGKDWLNVDKVKGNAGERIPVILKAKSVNPNKQNQRVKDILITSDLHESSGEWPQAAKSLFTFVQDKFRFEFSKGGNMITSQDFAAYTKGDNKSTFRMECSAPWKITDVPSWLTFSTLEGDGMVYPDITVVAKNNTGAEWAKSRQANIIVMSDINSDGTYSESKTLVVTQDQFVFNIQSATTSYNVETLNDKTYTIPVTVTDGAEWSIICDSWIGLTGGSTRTGTGSITFKPQQNGNLTSRNGYVKVQCDALDNPQQSAFMIKQGAYSFDSTEETIPRFNEVSPGSYNVSVGCMGNWNIEDKPNWLTVSPSSGFGNTTLTVSPDVNGGYERNAVVKVVSTVSGVRHEKRINVSQLDFVWTTVSDFTAITADVLDNQSKTLSFKSSGAWTASSSNEFVTLDKTNGDGGRDVTSSVELQILPNYTLKQRRADVEIKSKDFGGKKLVVSVTQPGYVFDIKNPSSNVFNSSGGDITVNAECSGSLKVDCGDATWLTYSVKGGKIVFTASANTSKERTAKVVIKSEHFKENNELYKEIELLQSAGK